MFKYECAHQCETWLNLDSDLTVKSSSGRFLKITVSSREEKSRNYAKPKRKIRELHSFFK